MATINIASVVLIVFVSVLHVGCDANRIEKGVGDSYPPVTAERLRGASTTQSNPYGVAEFTWSFDETRFVIEGVSISPDIILDMLGAGVTATKIEGEWEIRDNMIYFSIESEDGDESRESSMKIYSTGPIRIESSSKQYVFF